MSAEVRHRGVACARAAVSDLVGIEVFDSETTFAKLARKSLASYALDSIELKRFGESPDVRAVRAFIESGVRRSASQHRPSSVSWPT